MHLHSPTLMTSAQATVHCLTGCVIGEVAGLLIGVALGLAVWLILTLATALAYLSGFTLGVAPLMRRERLGFLTGLRVIWVGEVISIGVMEIVMNVADYYVGGVQAQSVFSGVFWLGIIVAVPAGFLAAWPVNFWLIKRNLKSCH